MGLLDKLFGRRGPVELDVISTGWRVLQNTVTRTVSIDEVGPRSIPTTVFVMMVCEMLDGEPALFASLQISPRLPALDGYLVGQCRSPAGDTDYFPVQLRQQADDSAIMFVEPGSDKLILEKLMGGQDCLIWLGNPKQDLMQVPIPFAPGLNDKLEEAWAWAVRYRDDLSSTRD